MQPYFLPYIGYYQLIAAVDKFILYDDVQFIRRGWINRNRILVNGDVHLFTVPIKKAPRITPIDEIELDPESYPKWRAQFIKTVRHAYSRAPYFKETFDLLDAILSEPSRRLVELIYRSLKEITSRLEIDSLLVPSSKQYKNSDLRGQDRILDICAKEDAETYINAIGGRFLYKVEDFVSQGIDLRFLSSRSFSYPQFSNAFVANLSILDVLMFNSNDTVRSNLGSVDLL